MSVSLVKGQKVSLRKETGDSLKRAVVGLGWDEAKRGGLFRKAQPVDCDASAILCTGGHCSGIGDVIYFGNLSHRSGAVTHLGDNLTGAGAGDDEQIIVDLTRIPAGCDRIVFVVNIYQAAMRRQHFGMIQNAYIRITDADKNTEMARFNLTENYDGMTAMIFGDLRLEGGQWHFAAIGEGTKDEDLRALVNRFN